MTTENVPMQDGSSTATATSSLGGASVQLAPSPPSPPSLTPRPFNAVELYTKPSGGFFSEAAMPWWFLATGIIVLVGIGLGGFVIAPGAASAANSAAALAIIGGAAVVIERILESFWSTIDSRVGSKWPFLIVHDAITRLVDNFSTYVVPYLSSLEFARQAVVNAQKSDSKWLGDVDQALVDINAVPGQLDQLAAALSTTQIGNDQKLAILVESASTRIQGILNTYPALQQQQQQVDPKIDLAKSLTDDVASFLSTFDDNLPRRLISLLAGCILGYATAMVLRLDLFTALGVQAFGPIPSLNGAMWGAGVPLTGLIMGLGSSPTHEVIQAIQQYKQSKS